MKINPTSLSELEVNFIVTWRKSLEYSRGDRAQLRRASNSVEVINSPAFYRFLNYLKAIKPELYGTEKFTENKLLLLAIVAGLVARLNPESKAPFAQSLGHGEKQYSEIRFQQLLRSRDEDEFFRRVATAIHFLKGDVSVKDVCNCISSWYKEYKSSYKTNVSDQFKFQMATKYYQV
ncbi:type I-E CRISPR-associated protein Cse2/CasB [Sessilibacter sp. MAH4]